MNQILNLLLPIVSQFLNHKKLEKKSNNWNESPIAEKKTESLQEVTPETARYYHPVSINSARVTSPYGYRNLKIDGKSIRQFHIGVDYGGSLPVYAIEDSVVMKALGPDKEYPVRFEKRDEEWIDLVKNSEIPKGRAWTPYLILKGKLTGNEYKYKHIDPSVSVGDEIVAGSQIGMSGNLGYSMGAHLHLEVWVKGKTVDPVKYLSGLDLIK